MERAEPGVDGDNGLDLTFDIVLDDTSDGFEVIYLSYLGDAG